MNKSLKIKEGIHWVGTVDKDLKIFDVIMNTEFGTNYNSYIYKTSEKTVLIEVAKEKFFDEFIERVSQVTDPKQIDYVIVNHTEPDHTGSLYKLLKLNPDIKVIGSSVAIKNLKNITNTEFNYQEVLDNDTIDIGDDKELQFVSAPFLHWPDSMFTYSKSDKILFTCDFLGAHYATDILFNDLLEDVSEDYMKAYKYYFDVIMGPFKKNVISALDKIQSLDFDTVCPGHGAILRKDIDKYTKLYRQWSTIKKPKKSLVVIPYVSSYGYTEKIAQHIKKGVEAAGFDVKMYNIIEHDMNVILQDILIADGILIGSPTFVGDTLPPVWNLLSSLNPFTNKGLFAGAFGSYGWSGEAVKNIEERFKQLRLKVPVQGYKVIFNPSEDEEEKAFEFGKTFAEAIK